jgi:hypothetical protein
LLQCSRLQTKDHWYFQKKKEKGENFFFFSKENIKKTIYNIKELNLKYFFSPEDETLQDVRVF